MEEKEKKINYLIYALVFVVVLVIATIAVTYAHYKVNTTKDSPLGGGTATLECIDMTLSDNSTTLGLSHNYPITDELAMQSGSVTPLKVTITNNCSNAVKYTLALSTLALTSNQTNYIEDSKIRYKILKNNANHRGIDYLSSIPKIATNSKLYTDLTGTDGELLTKYPNYTLKQIYSVDDLVTLAANTSNTYDLYMWVDYYEGDSAMYGNSNAVHDEDYDGTTEGKKFAAALSLTFTTEENEAPKYLSETIMSLASISGSNVYNEGDAGYRYEGATVNNYITFNNETWRIIGVEEGSKIGLTSGEYYTKIIREYDSSTDSTLFNLMYDSDGDHGNDWSTTSLYTLLNGDYYNRSGDYASTGLTPEAKGLMVDANWYYTPIGSSYNSYTTSALYTNERSDATKVVKDAVGIMYPSDYGYAATQSECSAVYPNNYNAGCHNKDWLYNSSIYQWTIIPNSATSYYALCVYDNGYLNGAFVNRARAVRPVVYLDSDVVITNDGDGSVGSKFEVGK